MTQPPLLSFPNPRALGSVKGPHTAILPTSLADSAVSSWAGDLFILSFSSDCYRGRSQPCQRTQTGRLSSPSIFILTGFIAGTCNQLGSTSATVEMKENCLGLDKKELDVLAPRWHAQRLNSSLAEQGLCQDPRQLVWDCEHRHDSQRMSASKR